MADGSVTTLVESWIVEQLSALTFTADGSERQVFKTCDIWSGQISAGRGGMEAFERYAPLCFVAYQPGTSFREGDYDLRSVLTFSITVGVTAPDTAQCRRGRPDGTPGTNRLEQMITDALDSAHPADTETDRLYHRRTELVVDFPDKRAIQLDFDLNFIKD